MSQKTMKRLQSISYALWVVAWGSFGFTDGRRWITCALLLAAFCFAMVIDSYKPSDADSG
jgi:energy-converting hydrogenase Eha subunit G